MFGDTEIGIKSARVCGMRTARIVGHCGMTGPLFLTKADGREMIEWAASMGTFGSARFFGRRLKTALEDTNLPNDQDGVFDRLRKLEPVGPIGVRVVYAYYAEGHAAVVIDRDGTQINPEPWCIYGLTQAVEYLGYLMKNERITLSEAVYVLNEMRKLGMGLHFPQEFIGQSDWSSMSDSGAGLPTQLLLRKMFFEGMTRGCNFMNE